MKFKTFIQATLGLYLLSFSSCDSGDIFPEEPSFESTRTLNISYTLSGVETIPNIDIEENKLKLMLIAYGVDGTSYSKNIHIGIEEDVEQLASMTYIPYKIERLDLSLVGTSKKDIIYTFKSITIPDAEEGESERNIEFNNKNKPIELVSFDRLQAQLFNTSCVGCHANQKPILSGSSVYKNITGKSSIKWPSIYFINGGNLEKSSMYKILTSSMGENLAHPHNSDGVAKINDKILLESWIKQGAKNN